MKLTEVQRAKLRTIPDDWTLVPFLGDGRPIAPLIRAGMIEERKTDVTPKDWGTGSVSMVRHEWRRTEEGRRAIADVKQEDDRDDQVDL